MESPLSEHLRSKLIRLAHAHPEFRSELLPLLRDDEHSSRVAEWKGWTEDMPVQVVGDRGTEVFPNLAAARRKYPKLDPVKGGGGFHWAMRGEVKGQPAIRFESSGVYTSLSRDAGQNAPGNWYGLEPRKPGITEPAIEPKSAAWENLPKGWTQDSVQSMWDTMTDGVKHKITRCMEKMDGKVDDTGAYCGSLAAQVGYKRASGKRLTYDEAFVEAVEMADHLHRPVELSKNAFGGFSVSLFVYDPKTGRPTENVRGQIVQPGEPLNRAQKDIQMSRKAGDASLLRKAVIRVAHENPSFRPDLLTLLKRCA